MSLTVSKFKYLEEILHTIQMKMPLRLTQQSKYKKRSMTNPDNTQ